MESFIEKYRKNNLMKLTKKSIEEENEQKIIQWFDNLCVELINSNIWENTLDNISKELDNGSIEKSYCLLKCDKSPIPNINFETFVAISKKLNLKKIINEQKHQLNGCTITLKYNLKYNTEHTYFSRIFHPFSQKETIVVLLELNYIDSYKCILY